MPWYRCSSVHLLGRVIGATLCDHLWVGFSRAKLTTRGICADFRVSLSVWVLTWCYCPEGNPTEFVHTESSPRLWSLNFGSNLPCSIDARSWMSDQLPLYDMSAKEIVNLSLPFRETWSTHEHQQNFLQYIPVGTPSLQRKLVCETFVCIHFIFCTFLDVTYHVNRQKQ